MNGTMMALRAHRRGGPETLTYESAPCPAPAEDEVLIAVHAAAITFAELTWDATWTDRDGHDRTPTIPAHEFSGVVAEVGAAVERLRPGQEVFGLVPFDRDGAAADFVSVPSGWVADKPAAVSHVLAAAVSLAGLTAWQAVVVHAAVAHGERVLVLGGAGAVGSLAVQLAVQAGAAVIATHRADDPGLLHELGAERAIDVTGEPEWGDRYDVVIDAVGRGLQGTPGLDVLSDGGRLILLQTPLSAEAEREAAARGIRTSFFVVSPDPAVLAELARRVAAGRLRVPRATTFPVAEGRAAFESGGSPGRSRGKVVLMVRD